MSAFCQPDPLAAARALRNTPDAPSRHRALDATKVYWVDGSVHTAFHTPLAASTALPQPVQSDTASAGSGGGAGALARA